MSAPNGDGSQPWPPWARMPGVVVLRELIASAPDAAVFLLEARGYSQGCLLELVTASRASGAPEPGGQSRGAPEPGGQSPTDRGGAAGPVGTGSDGPRDPAVIGVDFGSGPRFPGSPGHGDEVRAVHRLPDEHGRSGTTAATRVRLWLTPLPPAEGFDLVVEWPAEGIERQRHRVPGEVARVAAWESFPFLPA